MDMFLLVDNSPTIGEEDNDIKMCLLTRSALCGVCIQPSIEIT